MQTRALRRAGARVIYQETGSSVGRRPELQRLLHGLKPGATLLVYKLDRVARSLKDLLHILDRLEVAGCGIRSLSEPIDTSTAAGRLMIQVLGAVAEFERSLIRERSIAGQRAAVERGAVVGRPAHLSDARRRAVVRQYAGGRVTMAALAEREGVSVHVIKRALYAAADAS